jgi:membrane protein DedA with SNARE-associated domain/rhodanese-related sulfurtransferase
MIANAQFLVDHGLPIIFGAVLAEQMGVPIPALPWLLGAGALAASGKWNLVSPLALTTAACLIADTVWFYAGRFRGNQVLNLLCRISLEPDTCIRRTQNVFTRYGLKGIAIAKFVPGLSTVAPPLAGMSEVGIARFLVFDGLGSVLYTGTFILVGFFFSQQIEQVAGALAGVGGSALAVVAFLLFGYIGFKFYQRHKLLRDLRMARITTEELREKLTAGEEILVLDLRTSSALQEDPTIIQGAVHLSLEDIEKQNQEFEIPRDRDIVLYCACPNEVSSARAALLLRRKGFTRVRPLLGGIDAWRANNYPTEQKRPGLSMLAGASVPGPIPAQVKIQRAGEGIIVSVAPADSGGRSGSSSQEKTKP